MANAQGVTLWLKEHRGAGWLTVSKAEEDEGGGDRKSAPPPLAAPCGLSVTVSIEQHGWWKLSRAVRWEESGGRVGAGQDFQGHSKKAGGSFGKVPCIHTSLCCGTNGIFGHIL